MRGFLTYLMMILFVGSHWLADLKPHFHDQHENATTIESGNSIQNIDRDEHKETSTDESLASVIFDDCCAASDQANAASDISCTADCGLVASNYQPYRPRSGYNLTLPADIPTASSAASNPFRPPIV